MSVTAPLSLGCIIGFSLYAAAAAQPTTIASNPELAHVTGNGVRVRSQPTTGSAIVARLNRGDEVVVLGQITRLHTNEPKEWCQVALPVWVSSRYLDPATRSVRATRLNLRGGPGANYPVLGTLTQGTVVHTLGTRGEWSRIHVPHTASGFIAASLLARKTPTPNPQPIRQPEQPEVAQRLEHPRLVVTRPTIPPPAPAESEEPPSLAVTAPASPDPAAEANEPPSTLQPAPATIPSEEPQMAARASEPAIPQPEAPVKASDPGITQAEAPVTLPEPDMLQAEEPVTLSEPAIPQTEAPVKASDPGITQAEAPVTLPEPDMLQAEEPVTLSEPAIPQPEAPVKASDPGITQAEAPVTLPERDILQAEEPVTLSEPPEITDPHVTLLPTEPEPEVAEPEVAETVSYSAPDMPEITSLPAPEPDDTELTADLEMLEGADLAIALTLLRSVQAAEASHKPLEPMTPAEVESRPVPQPRLTPESTSEAEPGQLSAEVEEQARMLLRQILAEPETNAVSSAKVTKRRK